LESDVKAALLAVAEAVFGEGTELQESFCSVPLQDPVKNDCCFHSLLHQSWAISGRGMTSTEALFQIESARMRVYAVLLAHADMRSKGADMPDLDTLRKQWERTMKRSQPDSQLETHPEAKKRRTGDLTQDAADGGALRTPMAAADGGGGSSSSSTPLRSADMHRCRLAVVRTRYWEAYRDRLKLVEFRSPRQTIPFFTGMILLFSLNAAERRKERNELLMAVVRGIHVLSCKEAYACFPVEAHACNLESLCKRWRGNNAVQCFVLDKNSLRVASEIRNLAAGNLGLLRQINDRAGTARFCCSVDLGKTAVVRLSNGKVVHCTYAESWPNDTKRASGRKRKDGDDDALGGSRKEDDSTAGGEQHVAKGRCFSQAESPAPVDGGFHAAARGTAGLSTETVTMELFLEVVNLVANAPHSKEVERSLAANFRLLNAEDGPALASLRDISDLRHSRNTHRQTAERDEEFRSKLLSQVLQYVANVQTAAELICGLQGQPCSAFRTNLTDWVQSILLPAIRERIPGRFHSILSTAAEMSPGNGGAAAADPLPAAATLVGLTAQTPVQRRVPVARSLFVAHQHMPDRCEKCANDCKSKINRLQCSCGAICCTACYGLTAADVQDVNGYACDTCREEDRGTVVVYPREDYFFCFACRAELQQPPSKEFQSRCPVCRCLFCQRCAALVLSERKGSGVAKRSSEGALVAGTAGPMSLPCPTCAGSEAYDKGREAVSNRLLSKILGNNYKRIKSAEITSLQLSKGQDFANELGDLLYDCHFNGMRDTSENGLPVCFEVVSAQLRLKRVPSFDPFHLIHLMGQTENFTTYMLALVCSHSSLWPGARAPRPRVLWPRA
jgi:hypothetical protein